MCNSTLIASTVVAGLLYAMTASAGVSPEATSSVVPNNVRMVQKSDALAGARTYSTIQAAINSITNASAGNPYVVKVMPGIYREALKMKPFVAVVGSGPESTVIQSSVSIGSGPCDRAAVMMASDSTLSDLRVVNTTPSGIPQKVVGVAFAAGGTASASRVEVWAGTDERPSTGAIAVCVVGFTTHAILDRVVLEGHCGSEGQSNAVRLLQGAALTVSNSRLAAFSKGYVATVIGDGGGSATFSAINNCSLEGTSPHANAIRTFAGRTVVSNSRIVLNGALGNSLLAVDEPDEEFSPSFTMQGSTVTVNGPNESLYSGGNVTIATSQLPGDRSRLGASAKLVQNFDENFDPIPNQ